MKKLSVIYTPTSLLKTFHLFGLAVLTAGLALPVHAGGGLAGAYHQPLIKPGVIKPAVNKNQLFQKNLGVRAPSLRPGTCPDLVIQGLHVVNVQYNNGQYAFGVAGVVRNVGSADYVSRPNQQSVNFSGAGLPARSLRFGNVRRGGSIQTGAVFRVPGGEFTPDITAMLSFDPDIKMDKNTGNDECNTRNNKAVLSRSVINQAIRNYDRTHGRR